MGKNEDFIEVFGTRVHNLKEIDVKIPRDKLVVITGLSGSGKSSLAFDTIYAEGQRRYIETFSAYIRTRIPNTVYNRKITLPRVLPVHHLKNSVTT